MLSTGVCDSGSPSAAPTGGSATAPELRLLLLAASLQEAVGFPAQSSLAPHSPSSTLQALVPFHNLGLLIGLFSPRCADLWPATRQEAVSCVHSLLYLQLGYEGEPLAGKRCGGTRSRVGASSGQSPPPGFTRSRAPAGFARDYRDTAVERLLVLKGGLVHSDPATLFHTCHSIAQVPAGAPPACWGPGLSQGHLYGQALQGARWGTAWASGLGTWTGCMVVFHSEN